MPVDIIEKIFSKWAEYTGYSPDKTKFNLKTLRLERSGGRIQSIMDEYDPTGTIGMLYAKKVFMDEMKETKVSAYDILTDGSVLQKQKEMWTLFTCQEAVEVEDTYISALERMTESILGHTMIGKSDREELLDTLFGSIAGVIEEIGSCRVDVYRHGGPIKPIQKISKSVHVFPRLSNCVLALEKGEEGAYCCYIDSGDMDGYFGLFIKSNGTIFSVNDRVDEPYIAAHEKSRGGHWMRGKCVRLFPYECGLLDFTAHNSHGFATKCELTVDDKLSFANMEPCYYYPIIIGCALLSSKYAGRDLRDTPITLMNSLLAANTKFLEKGSEVGLAVIENTAIVAANAEYQPSFNREEALSGAAASRINSRCDTCTFNEEENIFVQLYGKNFEFTADELLVDPTMKMLLDGSATAPTELAPEYIGSADRMDALAYYNMRQKLAQHVRDEMLREYINFGGRDAVVKWWHEAVLAKQDDILALCLEKAAEERDGVSANNSLTAIIKMETDKNSRRGCHSSSRPHELPFNELDHTKAVLDMNDLSRSTVFFHFQPKTWEDLERLVGQDVPRIVKGWTTGHRTTYGNSLLRATDAMDLVGTPLEPEEAQRNPYYCVPAWLNERESLEKRLTWPDWVPESFRIDVRKRKKSTFGFKFTVGLSKRHLNAMFKQKKD